MPQLKLLRPDRPNQIRQRRLALGMTQEQAGAVIYAAKRTWQDWELGNRNMPDIKFEVWMERTSEFSEFSYEKDEAETNPG